MRKIKAILSVLDAINDRKDAEAAANFLFDHLLSVFLLGTEPCSRKRYSREDGANK